MIWLIKLIWSCLVCSRPIVKSYWSLPLFKLPAAKPDDPFALLNQNKNQTSLYIAGHGWVIKRSNRGHWKAKIEVKEEVKRIMNWGLCWFEHLSLVEELEQVIFKEGHSRENRWRGFRAGQNPKSLDSRSVYQISCHKK